MIAISLEVGQPVAAATYETAITLDDCSFVLKICLSYCHQFVG